MSWDVPTKDYCPDCGKTLFKRSGKGRNKPYCINDACVSFVPEDKRGYKKKAPAADSAVESETVAEPSAEEQPAKKAAEKKATTKKTTKSAAKKKAEQD